jgi:hypothetical protein
MLKLPQATWISTFLEGVTDKSTGLPLFSELVWFEYKEQDHGDVAKVMYLLN